MALLKGQDPLGLSETGRTFYIYAAELVLALLPVHIFLTMPELFHGRIRPFWPFIVIAIAYAGGNAKLPCKTSRLTSPSRTAGTHRRSIASVTGARFLGRRAQSQRQILYDPVFLAAFCTPGSPSSGANRFTRRRPWSRETRRYGLCCTNLDIPSSSIRSSG